MGKGVRGDTSVAKVLGRVRRGLVRKRVTSSTILTAVCMCTASALVITGGIGYIRHRETTDIHIAETSNPGGEVSLPDTTITISETENDVQLNSRELLSAIGDRAEAAVSLLDALRVPADHHAGLREEITQLDALFLALEQQIRDTLQTIDGIDAGTSDGNREAAYEALLRFVDEFKKVLVLAQQADERLAKAGRILKENADTMKLSGREVAELTEAMRHLVDGSAIDVESQTAEGLLNDAFRNSEKRLQELTADKRQEEKDVSAQNEVLKRVAALSVSLNNIAETRRGIDTVLKKKTTPVTVVTETVQAPQTAPKKITRVRTINPLSWTRDEILEFQKMPGYRLNGANTLMHNIAFYMMNNFSQSGGMYQQLKYYRRKRGLELGKTLGEYDIWLFRNDPDQWWLSTIDIAKLLEEEALEAEKEMAATDTEEEEAIENEETDVVADPEEAAPEETMTTDTEAVTEDAEMVSDETEAVSEEGSGEDTKAAEEIADEESAEEISDEGTTEEASDPDALQAVPEPADTAETSEVNDTQDTGETNTEAGEQDPEE